MLFRDRLTLDKQRRNSDGYMAIHARAARTGIQQYMGIEVDPEGQHFAADEIVNVYRPADEVFDKDSVSSFIGKPITNDHPKEAVTSENWKDLAGGTIMGAARDTIDSGDFLGFDLAFMDAKLIADVDAGKSELSNGYGADLSIEDGIAPCGTAYQAVQRNIRGNHVAVVDAGRAGKECRIGDAAHCITIDANSVKSLLIDQRTYEDRIRDAKTDPSNSGKDEIPMPKIIVVDGHQIDIANVEVAAATIATLQDKAKAADERAVKAEADVATLTTDKATADAKIITLEQQLKDSKPSAADLRDAAKSFADVSGKATALGVTVADDADEPAIKRAVVDAKLGDVAKDWTDDQIAASFASLTADVKIGDAPAQNSTNNLRDAAIQNTGNVRPITDARAGIEQAKRAKLSHQSQQYRPENRA